MNKYFVDNPEMVLGTMEMKTTQYGLDSTCIPNNDIPLENQLDYAITNIHAEISEYEIDDISAENYQLSLLSDLDDLYEENLNCIK